MAVDTSPASAVDTKEQASKGPRWPEVVLSVLVLAGLGILYWGYIGKPMWEGARDKYIWDYLELLVVPAALAIGCTGLTSGRLRVKNRPKMRW